MGDPSLFELQARLVQVRMIYPNLIEKTYQHVRKSLLKLLNECKYDENEIPDIIDELLPICNNYTDITGDEDLSKLLDQTRAVIILAAKKNCKMSEVIDAI
ncbi:uncharacterized protein LOC123679770 [Harmonia axyridis]|uniref:uncharacterized protein LOC123679770 n=1 Tax=Harmonia axyridis TaxID=115357 RepID=UPI001E275C2E|nr:uncharacterized protein LOC123679770 [Harmonia axyridis]